MGKPNRPKRRRTSLTKMKRMLFGKKDDDEEARKDWRDFILDINWIPKCAVTPFFKLKIKKDKLYIVEEEREPTLEELQEIEIPLLAIH